VPRSVVGVHRSVPGQPGELTRPRAAPAHQTVHEHDRRPGATATGQGLGCHAPHLAR
jgi:hypothetical protein